MANKAVNTVVKIGALLIFIGAIIVWRLRKAMLKWQLEYPLAETFITVPQLHVSVERNQDQSIRISWRVDGDEVHIRAGSNPNDFSTEIAVVKNASEYLVSQDPFPGKRTYYCLTIYKAGALIEEVITAERVLHLQGAFNFRDIGGYPTKDGKTVRWGKVYRSANLSELSDESVAYVSGLGIKLVCDLRSAEEVGDRPDRLPSPAPNVLMLPIVDPSNPFVRMARIFSNWNRVDSIMLEGYARVVLDQNAAAFARIFHHLKDENSLPAIIHCTAGKDRAGMATAILLIALGVPEEIVIQDYSLSNLYFSYFRDVMDRTITPLKRFGVTVDDIRPLLSASPAVMKGALDHLHKEYGSVEAYLARASVTAEDIEQIKRLLLED